MPEELPDLSALSSSINETQELDCSYETNCYGEDSDESPKRSDDGYLDMSLSNADQEHTDNA